MNATRKSASSSLDHIVGVWPRNSAIKLMVLVQNTTSAKMMLTPALNAHANPTAKHSLEYEIRSAVAQSARPPCESHASSVKGTSKLNCVTKRLYSNARTDSECCLAIGTLSSLTRGSLKDVCTGRERNGPTPLRKPRQRVHKDSHWAGAREPRLGHEETYRAATASTSRIPKPPKIKRTREPRASSPQYPTCLIETTRGNKRQKWATMLVMGA
jgi:hypothetical protein